MHGKQVGLRGGLSGNLMEVVDFRVRGVGIRHCRRRGKGPAAGLRAELCNLAVPVSDIEKGSRKVNETTSRPR